MRISLNGSGATLARVESDYRTVHLDTGAVADLPDGTITWLPAGTVLRLSDPSTRGAITPPESP